MGKRQVERFAGMIKCRNDWHRLEVRVRDDPDFVLEVEGARLLRDISGGKILTKKALKVRALGFADYLSSAVRAEFINHHPVVVEQGLNEACRVSDQTLCGRDCADAIGHCSRKIERLSDCTLGRFDFDDRIALEAVDGEVELTIAYLPSK